MQKILILSKDNKLANLVSRQLKKNQVNHVVTLEQVYNLLEKIHYDVFIVQYDEYKTQVFELLDFLYQDYFSIRSLLLTNHHLTLTERSAVYKTGCFDILTAPFLPIELKQKIQHLLSLVKVFPDYTICAGPVKLNPQTGTLVVANKKPKPLRKMESNILACLLRHRPRVVTKNMLIDYVWGPIDQTPCYSTLDVYIRRLRIHLGKFHNLIKTSRGFGYYFAS